LIPAAAEAGKQDRRRWSACSALLAADPRAQVMRDAMALVVEQLTDQRAA
jgi:hypothetical protein